MPKHFFHSLSRIHLLAYATDQLCRMILNIMVFILSFVLMAYLLVLAFLHWYWLVLAIPWAIGVVLMEILYVAVPRAFDEDITVWGTIRTDGSEMVFKSFIWPLGLLYLWLKSYYDSRYD